MSKASSLIITFLGLLLVGGVKVQGQVQIDTNPCNITLTDGTIYTNSIVMRVLPDGVVINSDDSIRKVPFTKLIPELQKKYGYDLDKEKQFEEAEKKNKFIRDHAFYCLYYVIQKLENGLLVVLAPYDYGKPKEIRDNRVIFIEGKCPNSTEGYYYLCKVYRSGDYKYVDVNDNSRSVIKMSFLDYKPLSKLSFYLDPSGRSK